MDEEHAPSSVQELRDSHSDWWVERVDEAGNLDGLILRPENLFP